MMFASIAPLLMTGAYAERLRWRPFVIFTTLWEIFVYVLMMLWPDGRSEEQGNMITESLLRV